MDESFEAKPDEEEDGEEFMGDRRVVEREADQAGEVCLFSIVHF